MGSVLLQDLPTPSLIARLRQSSDPASSEEFWVIWLRHRGVVEAAALAMRTPPGADPDDFRRRVVERAEGRCAKALIAFREGCGLESYFRMVARTAFLDEYRHWKSGNGRMVSLEALSGPNCDDLETRESGGGAFCSDSVDPSDEVERAQLADTLELALNRLAAESDRSLQIVRALRLRIREDWPRKQVAELLRVSERQVDRYVHEGLMKLRGILEPLGVRGLESETSVPRGGAS